MATAFITPELVRPQLSDPVGLVEGDQRVELVGIGWQGYVTLLGVLGERSRPRVIYLDGDVLLMSPSNIRERLNERFGMFVRLVVIELDIPCEPTKETRFHRHDNEAGVQPDDSFYLANHAMIAAKDGKEDIDLRVEPPPDLVIEIEHTHEATKAVEVLRRLGIPEVWVGRVDGLTILVRQDDGRYVESPISSCFPFLTAAEIFQWATRPGMASMNQWVKELRLWIHETLVPRVQGPPNI